MKTYQQLPRIERDSFALYSGLPLKPMGHCSLKELLKLPGLFARAENSGSEACYVEVARWNRYAKRYEKFAFQKYFVGELWDDLGDTETCVRVAAMINRVSGSWFDMIKSRHKQLDKYETAPGQWTTYAKAMPVSICEATQYETARFIHYLPSWNPTQTRTTP